MNTLRILLSVLTAALATATSAQAITVAYWNMDGATLVDKLPANEGAQAGTVGAAFYEIDVGFLGEIAPHISGTTDNLIPPASDPNRAVGFFRAASVYFDGGFLMSGFDFTGLSDVSISFAYQSGSIFTWDEDLHVDYRINGGSWQDIPEDESWASGWQVANISFGSALDNASVVDLRIRTHSWFSGFGYLDIDNVVVSAVPEPRIWALLTGFLALAIALRTRRHP